MYYAEIDLKVIFCCTAGMINVKYTLTAVRLLYSYKLTEMLLQVTGRKYSGIKQLIITN